MEKLHDNVPKFSTATVRKRFPLRFSLFFPVGRPLSRSTLQQQHLTLSKSKSISCAQGIVLGRHVVSFDNFTNKTVIWVTPLSPENLALYAKEKETPAATWKALPQLPTTSPAIILQDTVKTNMKTPKNSLSLREAKAANGKTSHWRKCGKCDRHICRKLAHNKHNL